VQLIIKQKKTGDAVRCELRRRLFSGQPPALLVDKKALAVHKKRNPYDKMEATDNRGTKKS